MKIDAAISTGVNGVGTEKSQRDQRCGGYDFDEADRKKTSRHVGGDGGGRDVGAAVDGGGGAAGEQGKYHDSGRLEGAFAAALGDAKAED